jgi:hypothetical protein
MNDAGRHGAPQHDQAGHTLTVREVEVLLAKAGVQRSHRHVLRLCQSGMFDAVKIPGGPSGDEWYVAPASVPKAIGDLKQIDARRARRGLSEHAMTQHVGAETPQKIDHDMSGHGAPEPAAFSHANPSGKPATDHDTARHGATEADGSRYVEQLVKRIEEKDEVIGLLKGQLVAKDEQISELSTRYRETHSLLGAMQRMLAPLLGQSDPYTTPENREVGHSVDKPGPTSQ